MVGSVWDPLKLVFRQVYTITMGMSKFNEVDILGLPLRKNQICHVWKDSRGDKLEVPNYMYEEKAKEVSREAQNEGQFGECRNQLCAAS